MPPTAAPPSTPPPAPTWRVVLARIPGARGTPVPRVLLSTGDEALARDLLERMRRDGAPVLLLQTDGVALLCETHPAEPAGGRCRGCGRDICLACIVEAAGRPECAACHARSVRAARHERLRRLFSIFLFAVFLYEVVGYLEGEAAALEPPVKVGIFQFVPQEQMSAPVLRALNDPASPHALHRLDAWFDKERARYGGGEIVDVDVLGPWGTAIHPPSLAGPDDPWWTVAWRSWRYPGYFHGLARDFGKDPDDYGARVYVVYGTGHEDLASHSRGSQKGRIAIAWVSSTEYNPAYALVTVAHELAHVLGAEDAFQEGNYLARWPEGFVEPDREPRFPQRYAEVMAVDVPLGPALEEEVRSIDQVRVGYRTAAAMGWITHQQADLFYMPRTEPPAAVVVPRSKAWPPEDAPVDSEAPEAAPPEDIVTAGEGAVPAAP